MLKYYTSVFFALFGGFLMSYSTCGLIKYGVEWVIYRMKK